MKIVIEGAGEVGSHLAKMLRAEANEVTVIDDDAERIEALSAYVDVETVLGNPSSIQVQRAANVGKADLFIAVYPLAAQEVNIVGALLAKQIGATKVIARVNDEDYLNAENRLIFKELGIELMFYPEKSAADEIVAFLKHNSTAETMEFARGRLQITVFKLTEDSPILDLKLQEFIKDSTPEELKQFRVIAISRDEKTIIPRLDTKFLYGDLVFTITTREGVEPLYRHFGKTNVSINSAFILGGGPIGEMLARMLDRSGMKVKLVENDKNRCIELSEKLPETVRVVNGDGRNSDFLFEEGLPDYDAFIALTGNDESNVLSCVVAKKFGVPRTIAEVENIEYIHIAEEMGVDNVINKKLITAGRIFKFTLSGKARFVRYMTGTNAEVIELMVGKWSPATRKPIGELDIPEGATIGGVIRGRETILPNRELQLKQGDKVVLFTLPKAMAAMANLFD